nr:InlB B-repeat-containing protein [Clostridia bacterium]
ITAIGIGKANISIYGDETSAFYEITVVEERYSVIWNVDGTETTQEYEPGATIQKPADPQKDGCIFKGWTPDVPNTMPAEDITFTAVFESIQPNVFTLIYNASGGMGAPSSQTGNGSVTLSTTKPTRSGYTFKGWTTSSTATTAQYQPGASYNLTDNVTFYAVWQKNATPGHPSVKAVAVDDIKINYKASATIKPQITADDGAEYTVSYSSSATNVASVDAGGKVTGAKRGTATITCTVTDEYGGTVKDTCTVTVKYSFVQWLIIILLFGWIWY